MDDKEDIPPPLEIDPYAVLGVESSATTADVKSAYKKLALRNHPGMFDASHTLGSDKVDQIKTRSSNTSVMTRIQDFKKLRLHMLSSPMIVAVNATTLQATRPKALTSTMTTLIGLTSFERSGLMRSLRLKSTTSPGSTEEAMRSIKIY